MKLALGTAQFGLDYGVSNISGQVQLSEVKQILREAELNNIDTLDTAMVYGESETILGKAGVKNFKIITKLPSMPPNTSSVNEWVNIQILSSLKKMEIEKISAVLFHKSGDLLKPHKTELLDSLYEMKKLGIIKKIGISIYNPNELDAIYQNDIKIDIVQAPFNIFDRRLESSGWLKRLNSDGVEVHARSIFLQGLLLQRKEQRNIYFKKWESLFEIFDEWLNDTKQSALGASLNFIHLYKNISKIIVGVQNKIQLIEMINHSYENRLLPIPTQLNTDDEMLINPSNWMLKKI